MSKRKTRKDTIREQVVLVKAMTQSDDFMPELKVPGKRKKRKAENKPRKMLEKEFELEVLRYLSGQPGIIVGKTEPNAVYNSRYNFHGFPDLTIFDLNKKELVFAELKVEGRGLREKQKKFQEYCEQCGIKYIVVRELRDIIRELDIRI
jgi:hypothetical protein